MFDENKAIKLLEEDRRAYLKRLVDFVQVFLNRNMDDAAVTAVMTAAQELQRLDGALQYLEQLKSFKEDEYPRFCTIME